MKFTTVVEVLAGIACVFNLNSLFLLFLLHTSDHSSIAGYRWLCHDLFCFREGRSGSHTSSRHHWHLANVLHVDTAH